MKGVKAPLVPRFEAGHEVGTPGRSFLLLRLQITDDTAVELPCWR